MRKDFLQLHCAIETVIKSETKYSRMDQVKFVEDGL